MKNKKALGDDGIGIEALRIGGQELVEALKTLFNKCLFEEKNPSQWLNAIIVLMHRNGDTTDLANNRPMNLLSNVYKLYAKIITKRLTNKIHFFLAEEQAGFR